jgi:NAD(P)-dependent dehydrogenase (short-subunit alcohol dehydrogenase family)
VRLAGARCLVVGGARRLGYQIALGLAADGAAVCASSRGTDDAIDTTAGALRRAGASTAATIRGDVREPRAAAALVAAGAEALGGLDVLVFAASGPFVPQPPQDIDETAWDASLDTIAKGFFFSACAAHDLFVARSAPGLAPGVIVAITDYLGLQPWAAFAAHGAAKAAQIHLVKELARAWADDGLQPWAAFAAHGAAKAAQIHLVKELARAWADDGVRVCGVAPGPVDLEDDEHRAATLRAAAQTEAERLVTPAQVVTAVKLCVENEGMTGVNVVVDAGSLLTS